MQYIKADEKQSLFSQSLAIVSLIKQLDTNNFLESDYYRNIIFPDNNEQFKYILKMSGLGNPALLQMVLYILLVVPNEVLKEDPMANYKQLKTEFNTMCKTIIDCSNTKSTYKNEIDFKKINYYKHIRNAISHSKCYYITIDGINYVRFCDQNEKNNLEICEISVRTNDIGKMISILYDQQLNYLIKRQILSQK